jgi:phospholipase/lecithinase/hemolysin
MKKRLLFLIIFSLLIVNVQASHEFYVFGDSLSDTGNVFALVGYPPSPPYFEGRFSNGPVWVEYLAARLGLDYHQQTNFAWGGALSGSGNIFPGLPGLKEEINQYITYTPSADPNGIYFVWAGGNDFLAADFTLTDPQTVITTAVANLVEAVEKLVNHGAQHVVVLGLPDIGITPRVRQLGPIVQEWFNQISQTFNGALAQNLSLFPEAIYIDIYSRFYELINKPAKFGLGNVTEACLNIDPFTLCDEPATYLFWDDIHPSTRTHQLIADTVYPIVKALPVIVTQFAATSDKEGVILEWNIGVGSEIAGFRLWGGIPKPNKVCSLRYEDYSDIASVVTDKTTNATLIKAINQNEQESSHYRYYDRVQSRPCYVLEVIDFEGRSDLYVTQRQPM